jgi:5-(carboxyamino)imidazole ribonucleotide mutase
MPKGVPVATVGINKAANAALLAARILALQNNDIKEKLIAYRNKMEQNIRTLELNQGIDE